MSNGNERWDTKFKETNKSRKKETITIVTRSHAKKNRHLGGGDNRAEKHRNRHRSILILKLLPQTAKAQSMTPQTTKYRHRTVTFKHF